MYIVSSFGVNMPCYVHPKTGSTQSASRIVKFNRGPQALGERGSHEFVRKTRRKERVSEIAHLEADARGLVQGWLTQGAVKRSGKDSSSTRYFRDPKE